jgi:hypothetical protein
MEEYTYMSTGNMLFICAEGRTWLLGDSEDGKKEKVLKLIKEKAPWKDLKAILDVKKDEKLREWCEEANIEGSGISFGSDTIYIDGEPIYGSLCRQIETMHREGLPLDPMVNFVRKMRENPSYRIRNQLWGFIEACQEEGGFTIAEDGDIMAYKVVSSDFKDKHTGTFDNSIGAVVEMPRNEVDDDPNNTCSSGLHFCAYSYVKSFSGLGDRLVLVKINPADVVSIPNDYGNAKARCCRYKVVSEIDSPLKRSVWNEKEDEPSENEKELLYGLGDKVKARILSYEFPDGSTKKNVVGRIIVVDHNDDCQPYKVRFFDGNEIVEWWVEEDDILDVVSTGNEINPSFEINDVCLIYDEFSGRIAGINDDEYVVEFVDVNGNTQYSTFEAYDLSKIDDEDDEEDEDDFDTTDLHRELKKRLAKLESLLKEELGKLAEDGSESESSEEFVRNWLSTSPKKMVIAFLESQYNDIMDSRMRLNLINDVPVSLIVRKLMDWYYEEYDGNITRERAWDKIRATIEIWTNKS